MTRNSAGLPLIVLSAAAEGTCLSCVASVPAGPWHIAVDGPDRAEPLCGACVEGLGLGEVGGVLLAAADLDESITRAVLAGAPIASDITDAVTDVVGAVLVLAQRDLHQVALASGTEDPR